MNVTAVSRVGYVSGILYLILAGATFAEDLANIPPGPDMPAGVTVQQKYIQNDFINAGQKPAGENTHELPGGAMPAKLVDGRVVWSREERGQGLITLTETYLGLPYLYGGSKPQTGFDCSGFTGYLYNKFGVELPRSAHAQSVSKRLVSTKNPAPGDLVFFKINHRRVSHVGMYVGGDIFIHSPRTGKNVEFGNLKLKYWKTRFAGARTPRVY